MKLATITTYKDEVIEIYSIVDREGLSSFSPLY